MCIYSIPDGSGNPFWLFRLCVVLTEVLGTVVAVVLHIKSTTDHTIDGVLDGVLVRAPDYVK